MTDAAGTRATIEPGSARWHAIRMSGIGASEISALFGQNPWANALSVYTLKTAFQPEELAAIPETRPQRRGHLYEPIIAADVAEERGWTLATVGTQVHPEDSWLLASPDRVILGPDGTPIALLEIKSTIDGDPDEWGDPNEDESAVPARVVLQAQQQLCVGVVWKGVRYFPTVCYVVALIRHVDDVRVYRIEANPAVHERIREEAREFWHEHVLKRVPPPWDGSEAGDQLLKILHPKHREPPVEVAPGDPLDVLMTKYTAARRLRESAEVDENGIAQEIKAVLGDREGARGPLWRLSWKQNKPTKKTDWQAVAAELQRVLALATTQSGADKTAARAVEQATTEVSGPRVFRPTLPKPNQPKE